MPGKPGREHVMHPQSEAQKTGADRRQHDPAVADDRPAREGRHDHRDQRDRGQKDDVDLRVTEEPEQMLPQQRVAAARRIEERPVKRSLHFEQHAAGDQRRKGEEDHRRRHQHVPGIERDEVDAHARRPAFERADDHLDGGGNRGNLDERKSQQPDVRADVRLIGRSKRRIHEPAAARRGVEKDRAAQKYPAE